MAMMDGAQISGPRAFVFGLFFWARCHIGTRTRRGSLQIWRTKGISKEATNTELHICRMFSCTYADLVHSIPGRVDPPGPGSIDGLHRI